MEGDLRAATIALVVEWFEHQVYLGRASYAEGKAKRRIDPEIPEDRIRNVDPLAELRRAHPKIWNTTFRRPTGAVDHKGRAIEEEVSILDTYGPGPVETRKRPGPREPIGPVTSVDFGTTSEHRRRVTQRLDWMRRMHRAMDKLKAFAPQSYLVVRMWAASYSERKRARRLGITQAEVREAFEGGITWLMGCIYCNPMWREDLPEFREAMQQHIAYSRIREMTAADLGIGFEWCGRSPCHARDGKPGGRRLKFFPKNPEIVSTPEPG